MEDKIVEKLKTLKENGFTYQYIGDMLGVTRQRAHQIITGYKRPKETPEKVEEHRKKYSDYRRDYFQRNKDKIREKYRTYRRDYLRKNILVVNGKAIKVKKRARSDNCELCGGKANRLGYHHWDSANPQYGIWVCVPCHRGCEFIEKNLHGKYLELKSVILAYIIL